MTKHAFAMGLILSAALITAPAMAKDAAHMKSSLTKEQSDMINSKGQNREPGANGTFQGKPVVEGPANWHKGESSK
ncbi:MAG: hypothetical protein K2Y42_05775 [Hyphomicrobium sp.]|jgi:hypothetical protein|uniref:hypothetical protein n=1 Tax=Hyphomicrobium sp. TaxID=82 RepID=UPI0025C320F8|nr:hypothetical protein [Hyphomicrobium sp.]MBX9862244.1 hypothetical protein [Hyphomicrobium sp.]